MRAFAYITPYLPDDGDGNLYVAGVACVLGSDNKIVMYDDHVGNPLALNFNWSIQLSASETTSSIRSKFVAAIREGYGSATMSVVFVCDNSGLIGL